MCNDQPAEPTERLIERAIPSLFINERCGFCKRDLPVLSIKITGLKFELGRKTVAKSYFLNLHGLVRVFFFSNIVRVAQVISKWRFIYACVCTWAHVCVLCVSPTESHRGREDDVIKKHTKSSRTHVCSYVKMKPYDPIPYIHISINRELRSSLLSSLEPFFSSVWNYRS